jgi:citrate lyase beta subunit
VSVERRLRRVLLFVPATERRKAEKAARLQPDAVILDLEDAIPAGRKAEARRAAAECLAGIDFGASERLVRVNAIREGGAGDLRSLARAAAPPDGFVLPKVESAAEVRAAARALDAIERPRRGKSRAALLALIESARGVVRVGEIARSHPRLEALLFGAEDLVGDLGGVRTREGREACYARSAVAIHAAAEGRQAIDTPFVDLRDTSGLVAQAREALALGYSGKLAIHPDQIEPILGVFTPDPAEVEAAVRLLEEHGRRAARGEGVFSFEGRMVDRPMIRAAEELLRRAERAGLRASGRRR